MEKLGYNYMCLIVWKTLIVGKGEIAHYEQFLLFPQCFSNVVHESKMSIFGIKGYVSNIVHYFSEIK